LLPVPYRFLKQPKIRIDIDFCDVLITGTHPLRCMFSTGSRAELNMAGLEYSSTMGAESITRTISIARGRFTANYDTFKVVCMVLK
jgi:hypothetical protein